MAKQTRPKKSKLLNLTDWDWTTLVAAWRYYEYRGTIVSASFPADIVTRFFTGKYSDETKSRIARQFAEVDHGVSGENDWASFTSCRDCDRKAWCKFYAFCKAWCDGFTILHLDNGKGAFGNYEAFFCNYTKRWYLKDSYINSPRQEIWCLEEYIGTVEKHNQQEGAK